MFDENPNREGHSPDQIVFQIDNQGYLQQDGFGQNGEGNFNHNNKVSNDFDNFGSFGKSNENNNNNNNFNLEMASRGQQENSQEHKYPYELGTDE